ncbi:hypothetical protein [Colwellia sp. RSH04]|uniref:hypothetical protein n=1 Tax=Colwellia sp. RSH04 TaxID=2305464 RepID=UPI000E56DA15|nr:hypothetical protein [Colwellia sp. RSH04]RHW77577.1 hypothetical protein D1094_01090 [Colwellia sp. RSH04]
MSTKPNQPKDPIDWIEHGEKLLKLANKAHEKKTATKAVVNKLSKLLKQLATLQVGEKRKLCQVSAKRIERHIIDGDSTTAETIIYNLNEIGTTQLSSEWERFGRQIANTRYTEKFYTIKVEKEQRQSFEDACLQMINNNEKQLKDAYRHSNSEELNIEGLRLWLKEGIEDRKGKHKHKFDMELMFILERALWES